MEEDNKLIAKFMELQTTFQDVQIWMDWENNTIPLWDKRDYWLASELKYHTSWDWLMPVVEKIEELGYCVWFQTRKKAPILITIWKNGDEIIRIGNLHDTKIKTVYNAVIDFIKWYNNQL